MNHIEIHPLPNMWSEKLKDLASSGDQHGVAELVHNVKQHVDQKDVFDGQWQQIVEGAAVCGLPIEITKGHALALFHRQDGRCALTGLPISFRGQGHRPVWTASSDAFLDRIDPHRGYVTGNVWWLHRDISRMKLDMPLVRFLDLCRLIADRESAGEIVAPKCAPPTGYPATAETPVQVVARYLSEQVETDPLHRETSAALWKSFQVWCQVNNAAPCTRTAFGRALGALGYVNKRDHVVSWIGLRLVPREGERV